MKRLRKEIFLSLLVAMGLGLSLLESSIPLPITIPGAKLGLANIVVLVALVVFGFKEAITVAILKSIVLMLATGSISSFFYSITGALLSSVAMHLAYSYTGPIFSLIGVSIIGALAHNFGQITVAVLILQNARIYSYLPLLMLTSLFTGYFVGLSSGYISKHLEKNLKGYF